MVKRFLALLFVVSVFVLGPAHSTAYGRGLAASVEDVQTGIDAGWDESESGIVQAQADYYAMTGRYFQGLQTHFSIPDGESVGDYPGGWFTHPTDQQYRWDDFKGLKFDRLNYSARIDVYSGPEGDGWVMCVQVDIKKNAYEKCRNYGPEALRGHDWESINSRLRTDETQ